MNPLDLVTAYQQSAVVAAACETAVADAIAAGPRQAAATASACGTSPRATRALLGGLVALGLADHGPGGYGLSADGAVLAGGHPGSVARIVAKEWVLLPGPGRPGRPRASAGTRSCWPTSSPAVALFDLMMLVENEGGAAWTAARLTAWLEAAGLAGVELSRGAGPIAVLRASAPSDAAGG